MSRIVYPVVPSFMLVGEARDYFKYHKMVDYDYFVKEAAHIVNKKARNIFLSELRKYVKEHSKKGTVRNNVPKKTSKVADQNKIYFQPVEQHKRSTKKEVSPKGKGIAYLSQFGLEKYVSSISFASLNKLIEEAHRKYLLNSALLLNLYNILKDDSPSVLKYFLNNILEKYIHNTLSQRGYSASSPADRELMAIYKNKSESAYDILKEISFTLDWHDVNFSKGYFTINPPQNSKILFNPVVVQSKYSVPSLNYLRTYLSEKMTPIKCKAQNNRLTILDKIDLGEAVRILTAAGHQSVLKEKQNTEKLIIKNDDDKKKPFAVKDFNAAKRMGESLTPEALKKYKSWYVNYLATLHNKYYHIIPCNERYCHATDDVTEPTFIFTISDHVRRSRVIIAVENLNTDRSTLLFSVFEHDYESALKQIHSFLQSPIINKRSKLRDLNLYIKGIGSIAFDHVDHKSTESYRWADVLKSKLRFL